MKEKILVLNGTISEIPIINIAKEMGYYVVTTGNMPQLPGHKYADQYIAEDYSDCDAILKLVKENEIKGIISCANDFGSITASYVGEKMGWPGHDTYEVAKLIHHKDMFREYFIRKGFPSPRVEIFHTKEEAIGYYDSVDYPVIVKASDLTGGKGIHQVNNRTEAESAIDNALLLSRNKTVLMEEFIEGVQQSIVVFLVDRRIYITSCSNIYCMKNPYLVQAETYPATDFDLVEDKLREMIHIMADDLNLVDGILSFQYIVRDGVPYVIDMMRRCFGNETLLMADVRTGFPWEEAYIKASLGFRVDDIVFDKPKYLYCGHYGVMADENGILEGWNIPEDFENRVFKTTVNIHKGEKINNCVNDKIAHLYFYYDDIDRMNDDIIGINDRVKVVVK